MDIAVRNDNPSISLMYHRIGSPLVRSVVRGQYVAPVLFRAQLSAMLSQGYRAVTLSELLESEGYTGCFAVTFDDGYSAVRRLAYPVMEQLGVRATIYMVAGAIGGTNAWDQAIGDRMEPMLSAAELRELADAGFEIGSHTMTHAHLTTLSDAELRAEVTDSRKAIEDIIGRPVTSFSYPYGEWDERVRAAVIEAGYSYAAGTSKVAVRPSVDRFAVPRINVRWNNIPGMLIKKIVRAQQVQ